VAGSTHVIFGRVTVVVVVCLANMTGEVVKLSVGRKA